MAGVKGMKWGVRKSAAETGVSRGTGAHLDSLQRRIVANREISEGRGSLSDYATATKGLGKFGATKARTAREVDVLKARSERVAAGKKTFGDKLDGLLNTTLADRLVSRTDERGIDNDGPAMSGKRQVANFLAGAGGLTLAALIAKNAIADANRR
mgnify:CR=1 FL=1